MDSIAIFVRCYSMHSRFMVVDKRMEAMADTVKQHI
jgi:hypothetical protein